MARTIAILLTLLISATTMPPLSGGTASGPSHLLAMAELEFAWSDEAGAAESRVARRCIAGSAPGASGGFACQVEKRLAESTEVTAGQARRISHALQSDALPRSHATAPEHGPPKQIS